MEWKVSVCSVLSRDIDFRRTFMSSFTIVIPSIKEEVVQRCSVKNMFLEI